MDIGAIGCQEENRQELAKHRMNRIAQGQEQQGTDGQGVQVPGVAQNSIKDEDSWEVGIEIQLQVTTWIS